MNLEKLLELKLPELAYTATPRDAMLYALGIGVGDRPQAASDLQFVCEKGLKMFPSQVNVICHPGSWTMNPALEVNWVKLLLGEQAMKSSNPWSLERPTPAATKSPAFWTKARAKARCSS